MRKVLIILCTVLFLSGCNNSPLASKGSNDVHTESKPVEYNERQKELLSLLNYEEVFSASYYMAKLYEVLERGGLNLSGVKNSWNPSLDVHHQLHLEYAIDLDIDYSDEVLETAEGLFLFFSKRYYYEPLTVSATFPKNEKEIYYTQFHEEGKGFTTYSVKDYVTFLEKELENLDNLDNFLYEITHIEKFAQEDTPFFNTAKQLPIVQDAYQTLLDDLKEKKVFSKDIMQQMHDAEIEAVHLYLTELTTEAMAKYSEKFLSVFDSMSFHNSLPEEEKEEFVAMYTIVNYGWVETDRDIAEQAKLYFLHDLSAIDAYLNLLLSDELDYFSKEDQQNLKRLYEESLKRFLHNYDEFAETFIIKSSVAKSTYDDVKRTLQNLQNGTESEEDLKTDQYYLPYNNYFDLFMEEFQLWQKEWEERNDFPLR